MSLNAEIKRLRLAKGWSMEKLAEEVSNAEGRKTQLSWQTVQQWEKEGGPAPNRKRLKYVASVLGVPLRDMQVAADFDVLTTTDTAAHGMAPIMAWDHEDDLPPGEYVMIPRLDVHLSAGPGKEQVEIDFIKKQPQAFRADWIREERLKPKYLACMTADGRSMEPYIFHKDSLVVDTSKKDVQDGKVYALWYEGGERVKRLFQLPGGGLRIHSDNTTEFGDIDLDADHVGDVRIIGQVVLRSGKGGL